MSQPIYKVMELNDTHKDWIQSLVVNGYTFDEIAAALGLSKTGFQKSLTNKTEIQHILREGNKKAVANATSGLNKLANGYVRLEKEYVVGLDRRKLTESVLALEEALRKKNIDDFLALLAECSVPGEGNAVGKVKIKEIEVGPDKNAAIKILEALKEDVWDLEGKRKKIPNVKIIVGLEGVDAKKLLKGKTLVPDYEVLN